MTDIKKLGEFGLISRFRSRLKFSTGRVKNGIGEDCAVFTGKPGTYQLASTDTLVEDVHFRLSFTTPEKLGRKALAVNISDIASMGGTPLLALVSLGIPKTVSVRFLDRFYDGLNEVCCEYGIELAGGDTVFSPNLLYINITILGEVNRNRLFTRCGARVGDKILVTGHLGDSGLGLQLLRSGRKKWSGPLRARKKLIQKHLEPVPRLREASVLSRSRARVTAMIDISDGLVQDLRHLCEAGNLGARLLKERLPRSEEFYKICLFNKLEPMDWVLGGGEDYELLFTLNPEDVKNLLRVFKKADAPLTLIGEITPDPGTIVLRDESGGEETLRESFGFDHFKLRR